MKVSNIFRNKTRLVHHSHIKVLLIIGAFLSFVLMEGGVLILCVSGLISTLLKSDSRFAKLSKIF